MESKVTGGHDGEGLGEGEEGQEEQEREKVKGKYGKGVEEAMEAMHMDETLGASLNSKWPRLGLCSRSCFKCRFEA